MRYFTEATSYEQIAAACQVPVGTVRSRLNQARTKLDRALRATAAAAHCDTAALTARRRNEANDLLSSAVHGQFRATLTAATVPDLHLIGPQGQRTRGRDALADIMDSDLHAGVRQQLNQITASNRITILECDLLSPPWDPQHCPPAVLWLMTLHDQRIEKIRLFHPDVEAHNVAQTPSDPPCPTLAAPQRSPAARDPQVLTIAPTSPKKGFCCASVFVDTSTDGGKTWWVAGIAGEQRDAATGIPEHHVPETGPRTSSPPATTSTRRAITRCMWRTRTSAPAPAT